MKRFAAISVIASMLLFGVLHMLMPMGFAHAEHGSMGEATDCLMGVCPAEGSGASEQAACFAHCLSAAGAERNTSSPIVLGLLLLAAALAVRAIPRAASAGTPERSDGFIGKFLLHQRLSTVVLRN